MHLKNYTTILKRNPQLHQKNTLLYLKETQNIRLSV